MHQNLKKENLRSTDSQKAKPGNWQNARQLLNLSFKMFNPKKHFLLLNDYCLQHFIIYFNKSLVIQKAINHFQFAIYQNANQNPHVKIFCLTCLFHMRSQQLLDDPCWSGQWLNCLFLGFLMEILHLFLLNTFLNLYDTHVLFIRF